MINNKKLTINNIEKLKDRYISTAKVYGVSTREEHYEIQCMFTGNQWNNVDLIIRINRELENPELGNWASVKCLMYKLNPTTPVIVANVANVQCTVNLLSDMEGWIRGMAGPVGHYEAGRGK